jgi:hypothetical protein
MALFGGRQPANVGEMIARKKYDEAIEALRGRLVIERNSTPLRMQLADVLILAGRGQEAVPVLIRLADEFANEGLVARSMAILKRVQKLVPGRADIDARIATFLRGSEARTAPEPEASDEPIRRVRTETYEPSFVFDFGDRPASPDEDTAPIPTRALEPPPSAAPPTTDEEERAAAAYLRKELLDTIQDVLNEPAPPPPAPRAKARSPLFGALSDDELLALYKGLRLLSFDPGDLILHQGDEGDRMFVIASGRCKVFLKEPGGRRRIYTGTLEEGEFFGELSVLRNEPRMETVVAATRLDLLELERSVLESLCTTHPRVREVLEDVSQQRLVAQAEALARRQRHGTAAPAAE